MMNDNKPNKEIIGDDYPTYEQYVNEYHSNENIPAINENIMIPMNITNKRKDVPHLGCNLENFLAFFIVNFSPAS